MIKICETCKKEIGKLEHYFEVKEMLNNKEIGKKYVHKDCQDNYNNQLKNSLKVNEQAGQFIRNASQFMKKMGMDEVVNI